MSKQALYRHFDQAGQLLYVGISLSPFTRARQHGMHSPWFEDVTRINIEWFETRSQAETAEYQAIKRERPLHNQTFNRPAPAPAETIVVLNSNLERLPGTVPISPKPQRIKGTKDTRFEAYLKRQAIVLERTGKSG